MTKISLNKRWFLSCGIILLALGCSKKTEQQNMNQPSSPQEQKSGRPCDRSPCDRKPCDRNPCEQGTFSDQLQKEEKASTAKKSENTPAQTPGEKSSSPSVQAPRASESAKPASEPVVQQPSASALPEKTQTQGTAPDVKSELKAIESKTAEPSQLQAAISPAAPLQN